MSAVPTACFWLTNLYCQIRKWHRRWVYYALHHVMWSWVAIVYMYVNGPWLRPGPVMSLSWYVSRAWVFNPGAVLLSGRDWIGAGVKPAVFWCCAIVVNKSVRNWRLDSCFHCLRAQVGREEKTQRIGSLTSKDPKPLQWPDGHITRTSIDYQCNITQASSIVNENILWMKQFQIVKRPPHVPKHFNHF